MARTGAAAAVAVRMSDAMRCDGRSANKSARACRCRTRRENRTANNIRNCKINIIVVTRFSVPSPERIVQQDRQRQPRGQCA